MIFERTDVWSRYHISRHSGTSRFAIVNVPSENLRYPIRMSAYVSRSVLRDSLYFMKPQTISIGLSSQWNLGRNMQTWPRLSIYSHGQPKFYIFGTARGNSCILMASSSIIFRLKKGVDCTFFLVFIGEKAGAAKILRSFSELCVHRQNYRTLRQHFEDFDGIASLEGRNYPVWHVYPTFPAKPVATFQSNVGMGFYAWGFLNVCLGPLQG